MSSSEKMNVLSDKSREELYSMINELKTENNSLKTELNEYKNESKKQKRKSFSERICDDLCEEILQYLSLEDKLRLECVSKQFQRTVFQRQLYFYINIGGEDDHESYLKNKNLKTYHNYYYIGDQSIDTFIALLKKCPNITSIELNGSNHYYLNYDSKKVDQVFQLIIENCNNLSEVIVLNDIISNESNFDEFHQKFGPKIKYLRSLKTFRKLIESNLFPNIERIEINSEAIDHSIIPHLKLDKLKQFEIMIAQGQEHMVQKVIDTFPTLTHFDVVFTSEDENAIYKSLKNISKFKHLIHFKFIHWEVRHDFLGTNNRFCRLLKQMANKSQTLKSIEFGFCFNDQNSDIRQLLSQLKAFPALKRLSLWLVWLNDEDEDNIDINETFSFELFKGLSNITHLSLRFACDQHLYESIVKDIDIYLPKLQYLQLREDHPLFETSSEGVTQMADILSRLSRLESLKMNFKSRVNLKKIKKEITKKCRIIKTIEIKRDYY